MFSYQQIAANKRKTALLIVLFVGVIIALGYLFYQTFQNITVLYFAIIFSLGSAYISYFYSDKIALKISRATPLDPATSPNLYSIAQRVAANASLPAPKLYIIEDRALNAFATGRDPKNACIAVTTGLIEKLDEAELEGVIAHEMAHIRNFDIRLSTIVAIMVGVLTMLSDWMLTYSFFGSSRDEESSQGQFQKLFFILGIILAILSPIIAVVIQLAISRKREYLADASGAELTKNPQALASALAKISLNQRPMIEANKATAHLFFTNPLTFRDGKSGVMLAGLFNTHPPIEDRIAKLQQMKLA
jgi:heat shock protein HtpX